MARTTPQDFFDTVKAQHPELYAKLQQEAASGPDWSAAMLGITETDVCWVCNKKEGIRACTGCRVAHYCSIECQRKDWLAGHKVNCALAGQGKKVLESVAHPDTGPVSGAQAQSEQ